MNLFIKLWKFIKQCWYIILLVFSSAYVYYYRYDIYQFKEINVRNLIFLLWLLLLLFPLFSEMEFLGVKVKKEVEEATKEVRDSLQNLQIQVSQIQLKNSVSTNFNFSNTLLPSEDKINELTQEVKNSESTYSSDNTNPDNLIMEDYNKNVYFFMIRSEIEKKLRELCEKNGFYDIESIIDMVYLLNRAEIIDNKTSDLIVQVIKIANRGVHGEIISTEYITFVKEMHPEIIRKLKTISSQLVYMVCPRCRYSGYSKYENVCPHCGYTHDDY